MRVFIHPPLGNGHHNRNNAAMPPRTTAMAPRIARLDSSVDHILRELSDIRTEARQLRADMSTENRQLRADMRTQLHWMLAGFAWMMASFAAMLGVLAKGFGWL